MTLMATVARITEATGGTCYLVTGDKDCRQLLSRSRLPLQHPEGSGV